MTELLVTPKSLSHMETLIDLGADAFVIGEQKFGLRLPGEFNRQQMTEAVALAHKNDKKVYAAVNGLFHNYHLDAVEDYINFLHEIRVDRIIFGDPAVVMYVKAQENPIPLHFISFHSLSFNPSPLHSPPPRLGSKLGREHLYLDLNQILTCIG